MSPETSLNEFPFSLFHRYQCAHQLSQRIMPLTLLTRPHIIAIVPRRPIQMP